MAGEEPFRLVQTLLGEEHVAAEPQHQRPATEMADGEPDVVPGQRGEEPDQHDEHDVQLTGAGVDRGSDQDRLPGSGDAEVLHQQQPTHREVAGGVQQRSQRPEDPRQLRRHDTPADSTPGAVVSSGRSRVPASRATIAASNPRSSRYPTSVTTAPRSSPASTSPGQCAPT